MYLSFRKHQITQNGLQSVFNVSLKCASLSLETGLMYIQVFKVQEMRHFGFITV